MINIRLFRYNKQKTSGNNITVIKWDATNLWIQ